MWLIIPIKPEMTQLSTEPEEFEQEQE
jgi:hypothetical protein